MPTESVPASLTRVPSESWPGEQHRVGALARDLSEHERHQRDGKTCDRDDDELSLGNESRGS